MLGFASKVRIQRWTGSSMTRSNFDQRLLRQSRYASMGMSFMYTVNSVTL
jgi:hypothetical protein